LIEIIGAKGKIQNVDYFLKKIQNISSEYNIIIQVFDADYIFGKNHLISSLNHAKRAFEQKNNSTNSLSMEILLYASGQRQIQKAIDKIGVKKGNTDIAIIIENEVSNKTQKTPKEFIKNIMTDFNFIRDDKVLEGDINTLKKFGISTQEIATLKEEKYEDIILEKVAMVDIIK